MNRENIVFNSVNMILILMLTVLLAGGGGGARALLPVSLHRDQGQNQTVNIPPLRLLKLSTVKNSPAKRNYFRVYPVFNLLRVRQIVQLWVLLPLVGPVEPQADLQGQHQGHEAGSYQHRT